MNHIVVFMKRKILFLVDSYYPKTSGVPVVVQYLAEGLQRKGHEISVYTRWDEGLPREEVVNGVYVKRFNLWMNLLKSYRGEIEQYRQSVLESNVDVIVFECSECVTTDILLKDLANIRAYKIFHSHGFFGMKLPMFRWNVNLKYTLGNTYNYLRFKWYYNVTFKKYVKWFNVALCLSSVDSSKKWLEKNARKVIVLQNAVDDMFNNSTTKELPQEILQLTKPYLLSVATFQTVKNQIGILREYYKTRPGCALVFIGPKKTDYYKILLKEIAKLTEQYGKRDVLTLVEVPRNLIPNIVGNAYLYLVGSTIEEYSISLIETMCKGVPFISTNVGNARILPGGITVKRLKDMHIEIERLKCDDNLWKAYSSAGKKFVEENCRRSIAVDNLEKIINDEM